VGLFKGIKAVSTKAEEFSKEDGGAALSTPPAHGMDARARVVATGAATGMHDDNPIVPVELIILRAGTTPRPVSTSVVVPMTQLHRLAPGATVPVTFSASNPSALAIDWSTPA
jgi:hypothetical protein